MMALMATKKTMRGGASARPDLYSKKRSGFIKQGVRISVEHNKLLRRAAELEGFSLNLWMTRTLVAAAKKRIFEEEKADGN